MVAIKRKCKFFDTCQLADSTSRTCTQNGGGNYCGYFGFSKMKRPTETSHAHTPYTNMVKPCPHNLGLKDTMKKYLYIPVPPICVSQAITPHQLFVSQLQNTPIPPEKTVAAISQLFPNERKKDELKADLTLKQLGVKPEIYHFFDVSPFYAVTIVDEALARSEINSELDRIFSEFELNALFGPIFGPATLLRKRLREKGIYGVAICDSCETFNYSRGGTIAKGRLAKHLKERDVIRENNNKIRELLKQGGVYDDPPRALTEEQRVSVREWYKNHKRYFEV